MKEINNWISDLMIVLFPDPEQTDENDVETPLVRGCIAFHPAYSSTAKCSVQPKY